MNMSAQPDPELLIEEDRLWVELHDLVDSLPDPLVVKPGYFVEGWSAKDVVGTPSSRLATSPRSRWLPWTIRRRSIVASPSEGRGILLARRNCGLRARTRHPDPSELDRARRAAP